jgi:putative transposase
VPLNAWARLLLGLGDPRCYGGGLIGLQAVVKRCDVVRLHPTPQQEELLRRVGDQTARLINMENYREKREGRLPPWMNPRPPGYRKKGGERVPIIIVRADNYRVDAEGRRIRLGYWDVDIEFTGKLRWLSKPGAKRGRMEITYDPIKRRWYAHISVRVVLERGHSGHGFMGVDLGREVLAAAVTSSGDALLYKGKVLKSDYFYFERRIAAIDKALSDPGMEEARRSALQEERRRLYEKRKKRRNQAHANAAAHLKNETVKRDIGIVLIGYPWGISQEKPGKGNTNMWSQRRLMLRLATTLENAGIPAFAVSEDNTSRECAYHKVEVVREPRGLVTCPHGHTLHADINAALNIMLRGLKALDIEAELPKRIKVLSFLATPSGVKPIKP